jgi:hypothetical protein
MEKRISMLLAAILVMILAFGCVRSASQENAGEYVSSEDSEASEEVSDEEADSEPESLYSAKEGLAAAEKVVKRSFSDAVFVGVKGDMDAEGKSVSWTYSFDSAKRAKGFEVAEGVLREKAFSFQPEADKWVDSVDAAAKCGAGEASLEDGAWVVAGDDVCELDAATGEMHED